MNSHPQIIPLENVPMVENGHDLSLVIRKSLDDQKIKTRVDIGGIWAEWNGNTNHNIKIQSGEIGSND